MGVGGVDAGGGVIDNGIFLMILNYLNSCD